MYTNNKQNIKSKECKKCKEKKPITAYRADRKLKSGCRAVCKTCDNTKTKKDFIRFGKYLSSICYERNDKEMP